MRPERGRRPPNAGQRCIHALARGYISHPVLDVAALNRGRCSGRCRGCYSARRSARCSERATANSGRAQSAKKLID